MFAMTAGSSIGVLAADFDDADELLDLYGEEETLSISTGTNKPIRLAPSVATVITQEQIAVTGARNLEEALEMVPGLHVSLSTNNLLNPVYSIRGVHTSQNAQVLLLLDGAPIRQLFNGGRPSRFEMSTQNIKRIEVIRGPGSAVYGADAFAGVINVVTKGQADINTLTAGSRLASFDTQEFWLQAAHELDSGWRLSAALEHARSDGDKSRIVEQDFQTTLDQIFRTSASLAPGALATNYELSSLRLKAESESLDVALFAWYQHESGVGAGGSQALDPGGYNKGQYYLFDATYKGRISDDFRYEVKGTGSYYDLQQRLVLLPPGSIVPINTEGNIGLIGTPTLFTDGVIGEPGGKEERVSLEFAAYYSGVEQHNIRASFGFITRDGEAEESKNYGPGVLSGSELVVDGSLTDVSDTPFIYVETRRRDIRFLSLQDEWAFASGWELTAGLRYDNYSDFGDTVNPRLALVWATTYNLTTKLLYGRAFRAPSVSDLFAINNPVIVGNPNLEPEIIDTLELAFDFRPVLGHEYKLNLFHYDIRDLIEFVAAPDLQVGTSRAENAGDRDGYGIEFEFSIDLTEDLKVAGNYAWQQSESQSGAPTVPGAAEHQFFVTTSWNVGNGWVFNTKARWIGDRERDQRDLRGDISDYTIVDLTVRNEAIRENLALSIGAKNIFDEDALAPSDIGGIEGDYPLSGRSIFVELEYSFE